VDVVEEFEMSTAEEGKRVCYFGAEARLEEICRDRVTHSSVLLGAQPAWRPSDWKMMLGSHPSLRMQVNRARNKGVRIEEWRDLKPAQHSALRRCLQEWLASRGLPPMHFLVEPETLDCILDRRIFVAHQRGCTVAFLVASPVPNRRGWLVEQIVRGAGTPNGTAELLIDALVRAIADSSEYVTLGLSPLSTRAGLGSSANPLWLRIVLSWARAHGGRFYNFEGLDAFKAKFRPLVWDPVYAICNEPRFPPSMLYAIASAFTNGAPVRTIAGGLSRAARREGEWMIGRLKGRKR
jgi:phosphatidylglycerol lysyltransferase